MKVCWEPLYDIRGASSRLRVFTLHECLLKMGHQSVIGYASDADVYVLQKHQDKGKLERLAKFKGLRVYDFDDEQDLSPVIADIITTDTQFHLNYAIRQSFEQMPTIWAIVFDPIDFCPPAPYSATNGSGVVWFGHPSNHNLAISERLAYFSEHGIRSEALTWRLETFTRELRSFAVAYLTHAHQDQGKSNNKALAAIIHGLPVVAEDSVAYKELLESCGVGWAYTGDENEALGAIEILARDRGAREEYLAKAQSYIWRRYHPMVVAEQWIKMMEGLRK